MPEFGLNFRKAREALGVSLDEIAAETRIGSRFLIAIENEEFDLLPGGIFSRGFIRAYADRVGLDPEGAVADFLKLTRTPDPAESAQIAQGQRGADSTKKREGTVLPFRLWTAVAGVLVLAGLTIYALFPARSPLAQTPGAPATHTTPAPKTQPVPAAPRTPIAPVPETTPVKNTDEAQRSVALTRPAIDVKVRATETTWIRVTTDGQPGDEAGETLQPGDTRQYTAQKTLDLRVGNAAGLALVVNDRSAPALGNRGDVRDFTITPESAAKLTFVTP